MGVVANLVKSEQYFIQDLILYHKISVGNDFYLQLH